MLAAERLHPSCFFRVDYADYADCADYAEYAPVHDSMLIIQVGSHLTFKRDVSFYGSLDLNGFKANYTYIYFATSEPA